MYPHRVTIYRFYLPSLSSGTAAGNPVASCHTAARITATDRHCTRTFCMFTGKWCSSPRSYTGVQILRRTLALSLRTHDWLTVSTPLLTNVPGQLTEPRPVLSIFIRLSQLVLIAALVVVVVVVVCPAVEVCLWRRVYVKCLPCHWLWPGIPTDWPDQVHSFFTLDC